MIVIINESQLDIIHAYEKNINKMINETIDEHKHFSDIADKEFYNIFGEFINMLNINDYIREEVENVHGVNIPIKIFISDGSYLVDDGQAVPKMESNKIVVFYVYYLNDKTKPIYDQYVNKNSMTSTDGRIKIVLSVLNGKLDKKDFDRAISTLPHEQIHGIQQIKSGNKPIDNNYSKATVARHSDGNSISNADIILSKMMWYFDKKEIDANIHKFIKDYRDELNNGGSFYECPLAKQIIKMGNLLTEFQKFNKENMSESLKKYGLTWNKYLKHCKYLLNYLEKRFEQVKTNVENGEYPYPESKDKWGL